MACAVATFSDSAVLCRHALKCSGPGAYLNAMPTKPEPYPTAANHLDDERERLAVRLKRLAAERYPLPEHDALYVTYLREREVALRDRIEARLEATTATGNPVPLDQLAAQLQLARIERCLVLALAVLPLMGLEGRQLLRDVEGSRHGGRVSVALLLVVLGLDLEGRAELLERLRHDRELIRSRLVTLGDWIPESPADIAESVVALTHDALAVLMGRAPITKIIGVD